MTGPLSGIDSGIADENFFAVGPVLPNERPRGAERDQGCPSGTEGSEWDRMFGTRIQTTLISYSLTAVFAAFSLTAESNLHRPLVVIILGPPGSGKTTQAAALSKKYSIPAISISGLLKKQLGKKSKYSNLIDMSAASGDLLDDAAANQLIESRLLKGDISRGFILDGYPHTAAEAKLLDGFLKDNALPRPAVVVLDAPDEVVRTRMLARHRIDDQPGIIDRRLSDYHAESQFLIDWYQPENLLRVDATQAVPQVFRQLDDLITQNVINKPPAFATR
jgi:adenylate kinase